MSELAEGARLEIACTTKSGTEGSNPSLSAIFNLFWGLFSFPFIDLSFSQMKGVSHRPGESLRVRTFFVSLVGL